MQFLQALLPAPGSCCRDDGQSRPINTSMRLHTDCLQGTSSGRWTVRKQLWELWHKTQTKPHDFTPVLWEIMAPQFMWWGSAHHTQPVSYTLNKTPRDPVFPRGRFYLWRIYVPFLWGTPVLRCITCARQPLQNYIEHMLHWAILSHQILSCPRWLSIFKFYFLHTLELGTGDCSSEVFSALMP